MIQQEILIRETLRIKSRATIYGNVAYSRTKRKSVAGERETERETSLTTKLQFRYASRNRAFTLRWPLPALCCIFYVFYRERSSAVFKERSLARTVVIIQRICRTYILFNRFKQFIFDVKILSNYSRDRKQFI